MAGEYYYPEGSVSESETAAPGRFDKLLKVLILIAVIALGGELIWLLGITPFRPFSKIDISGMDEIAREEILAMAGIKTDSSYYSSNVQVLEENLMSYSFIESARVYKHFPDRLQIILEGRTALASALSVVNGISVPVFFDSHGVIFKIGTEGIDTASLPVISGLIIENPFPGMRLPAALTPFLSELEKIQISAPELLAAISEFRLESKPFNSYDIIFYPVHEKIKVRLSELNEDLLRYTLLILDVLASQNSGIDSLDFRSGIASYFTEGGSL